jgi:hypothetical protein
MAHQEVGRLGPDLTLFCRMSGRGIIAHFGFESVFIDLATVVVLLL